MIVLEMRKIFIFIVSVLWTILAHAQPATDKLNEITERGRLLAQYDTAAWQATDAVKALLPQEGVVKRYIARKIEEDWAVVFGHLDEQKKRFLIYYEVTKSNSGQYTQVKIFDSPKEDADFYMRAAKSIELALAKFNKGKEYNRPYNVALLPSMEGKWLVYFYPAPIKENVWPLGGDVRYLVSKDGTQILDKRIMHKDILEGAPPDNAVSGFHTAVMDDIPEDTDVLHVLARKPSVPEYISTQKYMYRIDVDGTIKYLGLVKEVLGE